MFVLNLKVKIFENCNLKDRMYFFKPQIDKTKFPNLLDQDQASTADKRTAKADRTPTAISTSFSAPSIFILKHVILCLATFVDLFKRCSVLYGYYSKLLLMILQLLY